MKPHPIHRQPSEPAGGCSERTVGLRKRHRSGGSFQAWGRSRVFTPDCEVGNAVPTLFPHNPPPTLKSFLREPRSSENLPQAPCGSAPQNLICSLLGKEWAPTRLTQLAAPEKPETDILLPVLVQCWAGRRRHRATPAPPGLSSAGLGGRRWKSSLHPRQFHEPASHLWGYLQNFHLILNS